MRKGENIRKRKDGRWEGRYKKGYKPNGSIMYASLYGKTYSEVKQKMQLALKQQPADEKPKHTGAAVSFAELLRMWLETNCIRLKGGTKNKYSNLIRTHIIPKLGNVNVLQITDTLINNFLYEKSLHGRLDGAGGLSPSSVRCLSYVISSALKFAVAEDLCPPLKSKICKPCVAKSDLTILSAKEQAVLEKAICKDFTPTNAGIMISLYTGLRIGEICALEWKDVDLEAKSIFVRHTVSRIEARGGQRKTTLILDEPKTPSSKRLVPIPLPLFSYLAEYKKTSNFLFVASEKETFVSPRTYEARFHKVLKKHNINNINYHTLRHTFATRCIEVGVDVKSLSEILGHSNVSVTLNTYVHSSIEMKRKQLDKLMSLA